MKNLKSKHSQSEVIGAILLILLVVVIVVIITAFAVPFVKDRLAGSECFKVMDKVEITNNPQYTCYNSTDKKMLVQVHLGDVVDKMDGFYIELGGADSKSFEITNSYTAPEVSMYNGGALEIPGKNQERTYVIANIQEKPDLIKIYPVLKSGQNCDSSNTINSVNNCFIL